MKPTDSTEGNATGIGTIVLDRSLRVVLFTPAARALFRITPADKGRPISEVSMQSDYGALLEDLQTVLKQGHTLEREVSTTNGRLFLLSLSYYQIGDAPGGVVLDFTDITKRKQPEQALRQSEEKYRTLLNSIDEGFCIIEVLFDEAGKAHDYRFLEANAAFLQQTGIEDGIGRTMREIAPTHEDFWFEIFGEIAHTGQPRRFEHHALALTPPRWYDVYAFRVGAPEEHKVAILFNDMSERQHAARELAQTNQVLQATFDNTIQFLQLFKAVRDEQGKIVDFEWVMTNRHWNERWGPMAGKRLLNENPAVIETGLFEIFKTVTETGIPNTHEHYYPHEQFKDSSWFYQTVAKVDDGFLLSTIDITKRKRCEEQQALLVEISDDLARLTTPEEIMEAVGARLGEYLRLSTCVFVDVDEAADEGTVAFGWNCEDVPNLKTPFHFSDYFTDEYLALMHAGQTIVIRNTATDDHVNGAAYAQLGIGSFVTVTLRQEGRWLAKFRVTDTAPRDWLDDEIALIQDVADRVFPRIVRVRAEETLRESEAKYRTLFESIDEGVAIVEVFADEKGRVVDLFYHEANAGVARQAGLSGWVGKRASEMIPHLEQGWLDALTGVYQTGEPLRIEAYNADVNRWLDAYYSRVGGEGSPFIAAVFKDITERKQREQQQDYLLKLSDTLRPISDSLAIEAAVTQLALEHFKADRCYYCTFEGGNAIARKDAVRGDLPSIAGVYPLRDFVLFQSVIEEGKPYAVSNAHTTDKLDESLRQICLQLGVISYINVPVIKAEAVVGIFCLVQSTPREWTAMEIALAAETAERTWAAIERAQAEEALAESEEKYRTLFDAMEEGLAICKAIRDEEGNVIDLRYEMLNRALEEQTGIRRQDILGKNISNVLDKVDFKRWLSIYAHALNSGEPAVFEDYAAALHRWFGVSAYPRKNDELAIFYRDITERKRAEANLAFLAEISQNLVRLTDIDEMMTTLGERLGAYFGLSACAFAELVEDAQVGIISHSWQRAGMPDFRGRYQMAEFVSPEILRSCQAGEAVVIRDVFADPRTDGAQYAALNIGSFVSMPLVRNGEWRFLLVVYRTEASDWREDEVELLRELTDRIWVRLERARAEEALRESEGRLRALIENLPGGAVFIVDGDLRYLLAAGEALSHAGFASQDFVGKTVHEVFPPQDAEWHDAMYRRGLAGEAFAHEHSTYGHSYISRGTAGNVYAVLAISYDITDRKSAEDALKESEERLRITMENAVDYAIINTNTHGYIESWSRGAESIFGWTEDEVLGKPAALIFTPEDRAAGAPQEEIETALRDGFAPDERWHIRKNGERFFMSGVMRPIYDGKLRGFVKVARDLTEQREAEETLRIAEERHRTALHSAGMGAWDWNITADEVVWNAQHYLLLGLTPEEEHINNAAFFLQFVHPDDKERVIADLKEAVEVSGIYQAEFRVVRADGGEARWMAGYGRAVSFDAQGGATRMVGVMQDITERKLFEDQKDQFIGIASHELRTPVTSIKAYTEILLERFVESGDASSAGLLQKLETQVNRLTALIYALLDTTRITEGKLQLEKTDFDINALIENTAEMMQRIASHHRIVLRLEARATVHADEERIRQVLTNLVGNALKYSPHADQIIIYSSNDEAQLTVCVRDFGIGIRQQVQSQIFERFFREKDAGDFSGLGLGLFISANIIREHGGEIRVESQPGKGALFCFTLPLL